MTGTTDREASLPPLRRTTWKTPKLPKIELYLDDLRLIENAMVSVCKSVEVSCSDYQISKSSDIGTIQERTIRDVTLHGKEPYICVSLSSHYVSLVPTLGETPEAIGVLSTVVQILQDCAIPSWKDRKWVLIPAGAVSIAALLSIMTNIGPQAAWGASSSIGLVGGIIAGGWSATQPAVTIYPKNRERRTTFWERHRDKIATSVISTVVSGAIGYGAGAAKSWGEHPNATQSVTAATQPTAVSTKAP